MCKNNIEHNWHVNTTKSKIVILSKTTSKTLIREI